MAWFALILTIGGLFYASAVRSFLSWRSTGDTGLRIATGPIGSAAWWAKVLFLASVALLIAGSVFAIKVPILWVPAALAIAGTTLAIAGITGVVLAQQGMGSSWRLGVDADETTGLVTGGLFSLARNPIYTAMAVFATGITLLVPSIVSVLGVAVLVAAVQIQVRLVEEPYLVAVHGDAFRRYAARTGRFVPGVGKLNPPASR
jgi:protein-S-isoprenylcysteine O-methyltransferase Ste14